MIRLLGTTVRLSILAIALSCSACTGLDRQLTLHREKLASTGETLRVVGEHWLAGQLSGTFTTTALEQTYRLVEQERASLASRPEALLDPRGAELSQVAERLSRLLVLTMHDVEAADAPSVRRHLDTIPIAPPVKP